MTDRFVVFLPDGRALGFAGEEKYREALAAGAAYSASAQAPVVGQASESERLFDSRQLGELLGVGDTWLEGAAKRGELPCVRIGKALRFERAAVLEALKNRHADSRTSARPKSSAASGSCVPNNQKTTRTKPPRSTPDIPRTRPGHDHD